MRKSDEAKTVKSAAAEKVEHNSEQGREPERVIKCDACVHVQLLLIIWEFQGHSNIF